ncbi:MAG: tetratricopeptide repeat protein [Candidatus Gastranaerophilaceae bacterium]
MMKKLITVLILFAATFVFAGYTKPDVYKIDAEKNAVMHNNLGLKAVSEEDYYGAIQEFSLAILLNPKTQATAVYYNNLGETYMKIGCFRDAQGCFEKAMKQYNLNFTYYQNLVKSFKAQNVVKSKIKIYETKSGKDSMNMVTLGLLYVADGNVRGGIIKLDEFCMREPDLLITDAVRNYIKGIIPKN